MTAPAPVDATSPEAIALQAELADRYGRRTSRRRRRREWIAVGVVAAAAIGYLGWTTVAQAMGSVDIDTTGFRFIDEHAISIDFQITHPRGAAVTCALEAQDTEHGVVGWRIVEYPADDTHSRRFEETIPTVAEATTGLVTSCWIP
ncbi:DUF4307 domain-containing protein [Microbacterium sp. bgisy203]|uniref:DUF4307 domain-containing protein n=1 Tax=Microbacterium sp. bgisy203 TaxID=3413799 RepID=UPI003D71D9E8